MNDVNIINSHGWCFITNKQNGLVQAVENLVPYGEHNTM